MLWNPSSTVGDNLAGQEISCFYETWKFNTILKNSIICPVPELTESSLHPHNLLLQDKV
jgi:hypothetical protein